MKQLYDQMLDFLQRKIAMLRRFGWSKVVWLVATLFVLGCGFCFIKLADDVGEGQTQTFDEWVLRSLRRADDPAVTIGPAWLREPMLDITALGSPVVLTLMVIGVIGFMRLQRQFGCIVLTLVATITGKLVMEILKHFMDRDRPTAVPHLRDVTDHSFPSGHAMLSAIVYLTLGILLTQVVPGRTAKLYCLLCAMILTFLVGISRIYLGVHYPTDVLAGWMAGIGWALGWWLVAQYLRRRGMFFEERRTPGTEGGK